MNANARLQQVTQRITSALDRIARQAQRIREQPTGDTWTDELVDHLDRRIAQGELGRADRIFQLLQQTEAAKHASPRAPD